LRKKLFGADALLVCEALLLPSRDSPTLLPPPLLIITVSFAFGFQLSTNRHCFVFATQTSQEMVDAETLTEVNTEEAISYDHIPWPVRPSLGINYDFIVSMYLGGFGLAIFFFTLEKQILAPLLEGDEGNAVVDTEEIGGDDAEKDVDSWKEFAKGMQGMYFVFAPFLLCLPWSLIVRYYWMRETKNVSQEKKDD
jgi:hypothetical protein